MQYDVVSKRLLEAGGKSFLRLLLGVEVDRTEPVRELPRETVALGSSDFVFRAVEGGEEIIVLVEMQTVWDNRKPGRFALNYQRIVEKYPGVRVAPYMILFNPHRYAKPLYENNYLTFRFHLVRLWRLEASDFLDAPPALLPFLALMRGGTRILNTLDRKIFRETEGLERADFLAGLAIFAGLRDPEAARVYIERRRDIMRESIAYEILKEEAQKEVRAEVRAEGLEQGRQQGIEQGLERGARDRAVDVARRMLVRDYPLDEILDLTGLSVEEMREAGLSV